MDRTFPQYCAKGSDDTRKTGSKATMQGRQDPVSLRTQSVECTDLSRRPCSSTASPWRFIHVDNNPILSHTNETGLSGWKKFGSLISGFGKQHITTRLSIPCMILSTIVVHIGQFWIFSRATPPAAISAHFSTGETSFEDASA